MDNQCPYCRSTAVIPTLTGFQCLKCKTREDDLVDYPIATRLYEIPEEPTVCQVRTLTEPADLRPIKAQLRYLQNKFNTLLQERNQRLQKREPITIIE